MFKKILIFLVFIPVLLFSQEKPKPEIPLYAYDEESKTATAEFANYSVDEVWSATLNALLFEKFKPKGEVFKFTFKSIVLEKEAGIMQFQVWCGAGATAEALIGGSPSLRGMFQANIESISSTNVQVKVRYTGGAKKKFYNEFFELLQKSLKKEEKK